MNFQTLFDFSLNFLIFISMESKVCTKCNENKTITEYQKDIRNSDGYKGMCKACIAAYKKQYKVNNAKTISVKNKEYKQNNKEKVAQYAKDRYKNNKPKIAAYTKQYKVINRERDREKNNKAKALYKAKRIATDPLYRLKINTSNLISISLKRQGYTKKSKSFSILGCTPEQFKTYIESLFEPWMNWDNYGKYNGCIDYGWDIDHIKPISSATCEADVIQLNHYTNLRPLCSYTNRYVKRNKV